jgi:hypothetical protein
MAMQTVVQTRGFEIAAKEAGMTEEEREAVTGHIAENPEAGDVMPGTGGCRKLRWKKPGSGKSGGYRVITYFAGDDVPVFLLSVFGKGDKANLNQAERNDIRKFTAQLADAYRSQR